MKMEGASIALLNSRNEVLLFLRDNIPQIRFPNLWDLPGGMVEAGETPEKCIRREMLEEIDLKLERPSLFKRYDLPDRIENMFWQRADIDISTTKLHEGQDMRWFSEADLRAMTDAEFAFGFRSLLLEFYQARPFSTHG